MINNDLKVFYRFVEPEHWVLTYASLQLLILDIFFKTKSRQYIYSGESGVETL